MIKWLNKKDINYSNIEKYLNISANSNWFTNFGPVSKLLEERLRDILAIDDSKSIIVVSNGSHAMHAIIAAIENKHGIKRFAVPAYTFPSNVQGNLRNSIILDVNSDIGLDLAKAELIINDFDGIILTNIFGSVQDLTKYEEWCKLNNKLLILDNAAAPASYIKGKNSCNYGIASAISFHHTKTLGFGEGGAIVIDKEYELEVRKVINFGFYNNQKYDINANNWKMSDVSAAFIMQHLDNYTDIEEKHIKMYEYFKTNISNISEVKILPNYSEKSLVSSLCVIFNNKVTIDLASSLCNNEIEMKKYYFPLSESCRNSKEIYSRILMYPCHIDMSLNDIDFIIENIKNIVSVNG
jgi:dTDP-4-amino-4,6-dideoxygalactose transaminase